MQLQLQQVSEHANTSLHQVQELEVSQLSAARHYYLFHLSACLFAFHLTNC